MILRGTLLLLVFTCASAWGDPVDDALLQAENLYYDSRSEKALQEVESLLERDDLVKEDRVEGLLIKAFCHSVRDEGGEARAALEAILKTDPGFRLDPDTAPPPLVNLYFDLLSERGEIQLDPGVKSVAIFGLNNTSITEHDLMEPLGQGIADLLISRITKATDIVVVERERLDYVMAEIERSEGKQFDQGDDEFRIRVGKLIGAQSLLFGSFMRMDKELTITTRLVHTETGKILESPGADGDWKKLSQLIDELAKGVLESLDSASKLPPEDRDLGMAALREYSEGLILRGRGDYDGAYAKFAEALRLQPDFEKAQKRMRQLAPLVLDQANLDD